MGRVGWVPAAVGVAALVVALALAGTGLQPRDPAGASPATARVQTPADAVAPAAPSGAAPEVDGAWVFAVVQGLSRATEVRLREGQILAVVNGIALTPADLGVGEGRTLTPERYAFLLDRAVEHELTRQAALAEGIGLSEAEQRALDAHAPSAADDAVAEGGAESASAEAAEFVRREFATAMLLEDLATSRGVPGRHVTTDQVAAWYAENPGEFAPLPDDPAGRTAAWKAVEIEIRQRLAHDVAAAHEQALQDLRTALREAARIDTSDPTG